jgi:hypothetical protein
MSVFAACPERRRAGRPEGLHYSGVVIPALFLEKTAIFLVADELDAA